MSAKSPNGWSVSPNPGDIDITPLKVGAITFSPGVRGGRVHQVLSYVANAVHTRVQHASSVYGCWGYDFRENVNSPGEWSNHASGTAIDFNATKHPNGEPTSENWTPAQVDEIHAILDEVNGAVRWGGDYADTPDAMHFEIDVTPAELEGLDLPDVVTSVTIGSPDWEEATEMTSMSVSYPTMAAYAPEAYWKFTATKTGRISVDALLSHFIEDSLNIETTGGPTVYLYVYRLVGNSWLYNTVSGAALASGYNSHYSVITEPGFPEFSTSYRNQGRLLVSVEAGQTYLIRTYAEPEYPYIRTVVRIGDYSITPEWVQPPDQERIWAYSNGGFGTSVTDPTTNGLMVSGGGFTGGEQEAWRSFGGPTPGSQIDAINCCWHWARRFYLNTSFWWSAGNATEWSGGAATCPNWNGEVDRNSTHSSNTVGHWYHSDEYTLGFFYYQEVRFRTYGISYVLTPSAIATYEKRNGQAKTNDSEATYLPAAKPNDVLEWESSVSTLMDLDYAWDERAGTNTHATHGLTVKWYVGDYDQTRNPGEWGPEENTSTWYGQGSHTPEAWAGSQEHLGDTTNGASSWRQLTPARWQDDPSFKSRFTALPAEIFSDTLPSYSGATLVGNEIYKENYKTGCYIALKSLVRPSRYRIFPDPGIPDMDWAGVNAISIEMDESSPVLY